MQPNPFAHVRAWGAALKQKGWWHSFELPDGRKIEGASTLEAQKMRIAQFPIPEDLSGKRVLDVGTWDGWFAMEMERRGAEVVAIDRFENPRFRVIAEALGSRAEYRELSVYDLDPNRIGRFDVVLFMGVLYHLKHPILALERVASVAKDLVAVESFVLRDKHRPGLGVEEHSLMEFYENDEFGGEFDNWVAPTPRCLTAMCRTAGFARVEVNSIHEYGAAVSCYRTWEPIGVARKPRLKILKAFHTDNGGINFRSQSSDDYIGCGVVADGLELSRESVRAEVGGYGVLPVFVGKLEGHWLVNFKLPPGLPAGWNQVRLWTPDAESDTFEIAVDIPLVVETLQIQGVRDGVTWEPFQLSVTSRYYSVWVSGLPKNADVNNVRVYIAGKRQATAFVEPPGGEASQVNAILTEGTPLGTQPLVVRVAETESPPVAVNIKD